MKKSNRAGGKETRAADPAILKSLGEYFAAGYFEEPGKSPFERWARGVRRRFENRQAPEYSGEALYPSGPINDTINTNRIVSPSYSFTWHFREDVLNELYSSQVDVEVKKSLLALKKEMGRLNDALDVITSPHTVGGNAYTHSIPNYGRIIREGFDSYRNRIEHGREEGFYRGLLDIIDGIKRWHKTLVDSLATISFEHTGHEKNRHRLIEAYHRIPFQPGDSFFEAMLCHNFVFYLDDCDNPGRIDQELYPYYRGDLEEARTDRDEALKLMREFFVNCDVNHGWSAGIGGTNPSNGGHGYNELTGVCLEASSGMRRPNMQLNVRRDMPDWVWDTAFDTLLSGTGLPALYNDELFTESLIAAGLNIREEDLPWRNGGGCTETMVHGRSNVGSLDAGINLPLILQDTLRRALPAAQSFDDLLAAFKRDVEAIVNEVTDQINRSQEAKARLRPQPMRSLLIDDCIDAGADFNAGGARYNWSVINVAGLANVADSLEAVRDVVYKQGVCSAQELIGALNDNFCGHINLRNRLLVCSRYGNDIPQVDDLAREISCYVFTKCLALTPWRGGKFIPSCLMFVTYGAAGESIGATPDGRLAGEPIADSAGPHQGRDTSGPTAMLNSVSSIPQYLAPGTLVVNARFQKSLLATPEGRSRAKHLIRTYFDMGGMQLQINVVDQHVLKEAIERPNDFSDLIVRVGGYSEYFNRLSPKLKESLLERTEHST